MKHPKHSKQARDRILQEISMCREDERNCQNMQLQIIGIAGAILGALLGASFFKTGQNGIADNLWLLSILSDLIFLTAYSFIVHLGIESVLRYHYLRDLEAQLRYKSDPYFKFVDWMGITSPITTRNIRHLKHHYSWAHFFAYMGAPTLAFAFCIFVAFFLYRQAQENPFATIGFVFLIVSTLLGLVILFLGSANSSKIYEWSKRQAMERTPDEEVLMDSKKQPEDKTKEKELHRGILYYIYPKAQDIQKLSLIVLGAVCALFYRAQDLQSLYDAACFHWADFWITFVVIELLLYAARYQYNDLRGVPEDELINSLRKSQGKDNHGLPRIFGDKKKDVKFSLFITGAKVLLAFLILLYLWHRELNRDGKVYFGAIHWQNSLAHSLSAISVLIVVVTLLYEWFRTLNKPRCIAFSVGFGYALRFWAGFLAIRPDIAAVWKDKSLLLLLIAMHFYGIMSSTLPWTYYAKWEKTQNAKMVVHYSKPYYDWIANYISCLPHKCGGDKFSIKKIRTPWNVGFISLILVIISMYLNGLHRGLSLIFLLFIFLIFVLTYFILYFCFEKDFSIYKLLVGEKTWLWMQE